MTVPDRIASPVFSTPYFLEDKEIADTRLSGFKDVLNSPALKERFQLYLKNVFFQLDPGKSESLLLDGISRESTYQEFYTAMSQRISLAKQNKIANFRTRLLSLALLKITVASQFEKLMGKGGTVHGYMEVGFKACLLRQLNVNGHIKISGPKIVVDNPAGLSAYIGHGFPCPYSQFKHLNAYGPLTGIAPQSLEVIAIPAGLHHCPTEKLEPFIDSFLLALKPGGSLIIREYDALDALPGVIHSVCNLGANVPLEEEMAEVRNFKPLKKWIQIFESKGMKYESCPGPQIGDPARNLLFRFTKIPQTDDENLTALETYLRTSTSDFLRPQIQTYLTSVECHLTIVKEQYAEFIKNEPLTEFPHFKTAFLTLKVFWNSVNDARKNGSFKEVLASSYLMKSAFMLAAATAEHTYKGAAWLPLSLFHPVRGVVQKSYAEGGQFKALWRLLFQGNPLINFYIAMTLSAEYGLKNILSHPLSKMGNGIQTRKISVVIKDPDDEFISQNSSGDYKRIIAGRHVLLTVFLKTLSVRGIEIASVAGQPKIQLKILVTEGREDLLLPIEGCRLLGEIAIPANPRQKYLRLDVETKSLSKTIKTLEERGAQLIHAHGF